LFADVVQKITEYPLEDTRAFLKDGMSALSKKTRRVSALIQAHTEHP
jgi:hypothetical protein